MKVEGGKRMKKQNRTGGSMDFLTLNISSKILKYSCVLTKT